MELGWNAKAYIIIRNQMLYHFTEEQKEHGKKSMQSLLDLLIRRQQNRTDGIKFGRNFLLYPIYPLWTWTHWTGSRESHENDQRAEVPLS